MFCPNEQKAKQTFLKYLRIFDSFYLLLLGVGIGGIIACGAFAAPVVFKINEFIPAFSQSESGLIMGKIFVRLNAYLVFLMVVIAIYESIGLLTCNLKINSIYSKFWFLLGVFNITLIILFVYYYTPFILKPQNILSDEFVTMHKQSVLVFQALMFGLSLLFIWRAYALHYMQQISKRIGEVA